MKRIITVSTTNYSLQTQRLLTSLNKTNKDFLLTVYCDSDSSFKYLESMGGCQIIALPSINVLGVKRAKFEAYYDAAKNGNFLYLDSDIAVLDDLSDLFNGDTLQACKDDLSACEFIVNKEYPWANDPHLRNALYINSGIFYGPQRELDFFRCLYEKSIDDFLWTKYIVEDKLYDNHFLCAYINLLSKHVRLIDEEIFNWQGFYKNNAVQVSRRGSALFNKCNQKRLRIVHYAGIQKIDVFLMSIPLEISSLILNYCINDKSPRENSLYRLLADQSNYFNMDLKDDHIKTVFHKLYLEIMDISLNEFKKRYSSGKTYLMNKDSIISIAFTVPESDDVWNGLKCDGAYLEAQEYAYLRDVIKKYLINHILEIGAGETSLLFKQLDVTALSIEAFDGPWFHRAAEGGCDVHHVEYDHTRLLFDDEKMRKIISASKRDVDLIFIDSPVGTQSRSKVLTQLLQYVEPKYILFHDAYRDAKNIYSYQAEHGLKIVDYFESTRGLILLAFDRSSVSHRMQRDIIDNRIKIISPNYEINLDLFNKSFMRSKEYCLKLYLKNTSNEIYSSNFHNPVVVSYHWIDSHDRSAVFDGLRTQLPCDLYPLDSIEFTMKIIAPDNPGMYLLEVDLVQEMVSWFKMRNPDLGMRTEIQIT